MLTVFARDYSSGAPVVESSIYFQPGTNPGTSYVETGDSALTLPSGTTGFTFATWVKADWSASAQSTPALFATMTSSSSTQPYNWRFAYDSFTVGELSNSIFLQIQWWSDNNPQIAYIHAPLVYNNYNQSVTGLSGSSNSWNRNTISEFVHIAVTLDTTTESWPEFISDISPRFTITWNGVALETFEYWTNPTVISTLNLNGFEQEPCKLRIGPAGWPRNQYQDRTVFQRTFTTVADINQDFYASGVPLDPVPNSDFHWNWQGTNPYDSNGANIGTANVFFAAPGVAPSIDTTNYV